MPLTKQEMSDKGYPIIHIFNQYVSFKDVFQTKLLPEMEKIVHRYGGVPLVVCQNEPLKWRGVEPPGAIIINQWPNWEAYDRFNASGKSVTSDCNFPVKLTNFRPHFRE
ncbi:unnamed protein product [Dibothriocephalus latus]|uniref:Uncharacterized protein n=1 Tax=Dibothriocephalus latus TaxID=60516 RepID=A0A3P7NRQ6_DIBLA|nr:unnamed protein product [Dibothriocephalus latus]